MGLLHQDPISYSPVVQENNPLQSSVDKMKYRNKVESYGEASRTFTAELSHKFARPRNKGVRHELHFRSQRSSPQKICMASTLQPRNLATFCLAHLAQKETIGSTETSPIHASA